MGNLFNRETLPPQDLLARRLSRLRIALVAAFVVLAVSGIGAHATEKSDLALRDNPAAIAPEERDRFSLDVEYDEQNWDAFVRIPSVAALPSPPALDDVEFRESNWRFHSGSAFESLPATAAAPNTTRDDIEFREQNWHFDSGNALERQPAVAVDSTQTRNEIEFNEQNWNLKTGEVLDNGTLAAAEQDDRTSTVPTRGIYPVGPRLR